GDGYATIYQNNQPVSQIFFHLFAGTNPSGRLKKDTKVGSAFWADPANVALSELMPTVNDLLKLLKNKPAGRFFTELVYD
ncbi:MAG TPA: hypothetical protein VLF41_03410, partial [Candidatus Nanoarchaeia archaeon]|nr:hypothetical protein [Candidatus Nanoarchaeia archaeon]